MIYYIHGYLSSPDGTKGQLFKKELQAIPITYRNVEPEKLVISDCVTQIKKVIGLDEKPILIGSSLGGFLAAKTSLDTTIAKMILINPAIIPPDIDISTLTDMPQSILKDMQVEVLFKTKINTDITIFVGTEDMIVPNDWSIEFGKRQEATIIFFHDDHQFSNYMQRLPHLIRSII